MSEPNLIRNDTPHQVSMPEGTNVAAGKKSNASEPSVRKVLAGPDDTVNEHVVDEQRVLVPEDDVTKSVKEQISFDRQLKESNALAPTAVDTAHESEAVTEQRTENDHMALMPETSPEKSEVAFAPADIPVTREDQGPLIKRSEQDRFVAVPDPVSETMASYSMPVAAEDSAEPVLAPAVNAEADALELSETMLTMLQMDFPARVVKLKIENDKVRTKLDALQDSARH